MVVQAESDPPKRDEYLQRLMELPDQKWAEIIGQARQSVDFLKDQDVIGTVLNILQTNTSIATALGTFFLPQISLIFLDMLNVYRMYSELISSSIAEGGPFTSKTSYVKLLRSVKRETLKLIETFLDKAEDQPQIRKQFVPPIINKYKGVMTEDVPCIFEAVFEYHHHMWPEQNLSFYTRNWSMESPSKDQRIRNPNGEMDGCL